MTPENIASLTDAELRAICNAPRSDGEIVLTEKSSEWARRYQETNDSADLARSMDCAQAALHLYIARMANRRAARTELQHRLASAQIVAENEDDTVPCVVCGQSVPWLPTDHPEADPSICRSDARCENHMVGTVAHERMLLDEERESERWAGAAYQDALSQIGRRETEGLAD